MIPSLSRYAGTLAVVFLAGLIGWMSDAPAPAFAELAVLPAFPGAEGHGAASIGGRGGKVIEVTNLNDSGTGSLRDCIEDTGARTCVFRVGGTIELSESLRIENPFITIAGQTAPGGGIVLKNDPSARNTPFVIRTHDVIVRFIRSRPGPGPFSPGTTVGERESDLDAIAVEGGATDVIIDHSSFSWGVDENVQIAQSEDVTIQWSITSEALHDSGHSDGVPHSMGLIVISSDRTSIHHNLFAHNDWRNPRLKSTADVINNVIYNTGGFPDNWAGGAIAPVYVNAIGNIWIDGPSTLPGDPFAFDFSGVGLYVEGNILPERPTDDLPEEFAVHPDQRHVVSDTKLGSPGVNTTTASEAYDHVLAGAGASARLDCQGNFVSNYDAIDRRIIDDVINGTGQVIDHPSEVGGWVTLSAGTPCADQDHDGMADEWEEIHFGSLAQGSSSDSSSDFDGDGYTDLEEFLNGTSPTAVDGQLDTTPPTLLDLPSSVSLELTEPDGAVYDYAPPTAIDDVDPVPSVSCSPAPGFTFPLGITTATCIATDFSGNSSGGSFVVTVVNAVPQVWIGPQAAIDEGDVYAGSGVITDPGGETWTLNIDYGDGTPVELMTATTADFVLTHAYPKDGAFAITASATDAEGAVGATSLELIVNHVWPTLPDQAQAVQDLDGDGLAEDTNGNGLLDFDDVLTLFDQLDSSEVQRNSDDFDFSLNGSVEFVDIDTLFHLVIS